MSAKVKLAHDADGRPYAIKIFDLSPGKPKTHLKYMKQEVEASMNLNHKHIVKYFDFDDNAELVNNNGAVTNVAYIA